MLFIFKCESKNCLKHTEPLDVMSCHCPDAPTAITDANTAMLWTYCRRGCSFSKRESCCKDISCVSLSYSLQVMLILFRMLNNMANRMYGGNDLDKRALQLRARDLGHIVRIQLCGLFEEGVFLTNIECGK